MTDDAAKAAATLAAQLRALAQFTAHAPTTPSRTTGAVQASHDQVLGYGQPTAQWPGPYNFFQGGQPSDYPTAVGSPFEAPTASFPPSAIPPGWPPATSAPPGMPAPAGSPALASFPAHANAAAAQAFFASLGAVPLSPHPTPPAPLPVEWRMS